MSGIDAPMVVTPALGRKVKGWRGEVCHMKRLVGRKSSVITCEAEDVRVGGKD